MIIDFKKWVENQTLGGGLGPPIQQPVDPDPAPGQTDAFPRYHSPGSDQLPPLPKKRMKKSCRK